MDEELNGSRSGWIDIHSHLLPGIDDGCQSLEDSLECIERLQAEGFVGTICTPHIWPSLFPRNTWLNIQDHVRWLQSELETREIDYQLWPGGEIRLDLQSLPWLEEHGVPTLGNGRCVLVDYWDTEWDPDIHQMIQFFQEKGYQVILAHPERMLLPDPPLEDLLANLRDAGVWLQGNLNSISGGEGNQAQSRVDRWLEADLYKLIAMDMHGPDSLPGRFRGLQRLLQRYDKATAEQLLANVPQEIIAK
ncbi:Hypothetical protein PBC10988_0320 [Planctomycetales bacterium 10988]|nr:Hypothetical protein PBC10988_0320 [Planctomycetales bacterium 10988]